MFGNSYFTEYFTETSVFHCVFKIYQILLQRKTVLWSLFGESVKIIIFPLIRSTFQINWYNGNSKF